jgi:DNA polymerase-3 subunit gamma/tau
MAYTVLARRYRSSTFDDLIGQEHIARTLKRAIETDRIAHAFLFCGTRGTGKTSSARILAKCLNCEAFDNPTTTPCDQCESCRAIARGDDIDVIEIDAASNGGIDEVRKIIENARFSPARARFKTYIIDEVHAMKKDAFNALLKVLEEPPAHVKFILATTEPEKVLPTILSRCQRYDFRNIPTREIAAHLRMICTAEKVEADDDALLLVARAGAGSMRDALSLLDRLLSLSTDRLSAETIEQLLGLPRTQLLFDLAEAIGRADVKATLHQADSLVTNGLSPDSLIAALVDHLRNLLILVTCGADSDLVEVPGLPLADLVAQARKFDAVTLSQDIAILEELRRTLRTTQAGRALLDATLVRLALARQFENVESLLAEGGSVTDQKKKSEPAVSLRVSDGRTIPTSTATIAPPVPPSVPQGDGNEDQTPNFDDIDVGDDDLARPGKVWEGPTQSLGAITARQNAGKQGLEAESPPVASLPVASPAVPSGGPAEQWQQLLDLLATQSQGVHGILKWGTFAGIEEGRAVIRFSGQHDSLVKILDRNGKKELIAKAFGQVLQQEIGVRFQIDPAAEAAPDHSETPPTPPVAASARANPTAQAPLPAAVPAMPMPESPRVALTAEIKESLYRDDPLVHAIIDALGGEIVKLEANN